MCHHFLFMLPPITSKQFDIVSRNKFTMMFPVCLCDEQHLISLMTENTHTCKTWRHSRMWTSNELLIMCRLTHDLKINLAVVCRYWPCEILVENIFKSHPVRSTDTLWEEFVRFHTSWWRWTLADVLWQKLWANTPSLFAL